MAKGRISIDRERCKGCGLCISVCPKKAIKIGPELNAQGYYPPQQPPEEEDWGGCIGCTQCALICPDLAIEVYRD